MTGAEPLSLAEAVLDGRVKMPGGHAARASAVLARQVFEDTVDLRIDAVQTGLERASMRSRLIILRDLLGEKAGANAQAAWDGLSQCCHHHSYELQPSAAQVGELIALTRELSRELPRRTAVEGSDR